MGGSQPDSHRSTDAGPNAFSSHGERKRILLVEDEALLAMAQCQHLESYGYDVMTVGTGELAVATALTNDDIDLILMDIDLGRGIDGTTAATRILASRAIPIIFVSSHTDRDIVARTEGITSYGYVVKSSGITVLDAAIKMAFRLQQSRTHLDASKSELQRAYEDLQLTTEELRISLEDLMARESELRMSEERFRAIVEGAPVPIFIHRDGTFLYLNRPAAELFGAVDPALLVATPVADRFVPEARTQAMRAITGHRGSGHEDSHGAPGEFAVVPVTAPSNGSERALRWVTFAAERIEYDGATAALVFVRDVTERRRHRSEIARWNELLRYIIRHDRTAVAVLDHDLTFLYVSERFRADYLLGPDEVVEGRYHYDVFPDVPESWRDVHRRALNGEVITSEFDEYPRGDGTIQYTRYECRPWFREPGEIGGIILYTEVITDAVLRSRQLEAHDAQLRAFVELVPSAVVISDHVEKVKYVSRRFREMFGFGLLEMPFVDDWWPRAYPDPELRARAQRAWAAELERARTTGEATRPLVFPIMYADGVLRDTEVRAASSGDLNVVTLTDVSEHTERQHETQRQLDHSETLLGEIHHRVKNHLMMVESLLALQAEELRAAEQAGRPTRAAEALANATGRLQSIRMLYETLHRSEDRGGVSLREYVTELITGALAASHIGGDVDLGLSVAERCVPAANASALGILLNELITNSLKHGLPYVAEGVPRLVVAIEPLDSSPEGPLHLTVADNGPGITRPVDVDAAAQRESLGMTLVHALVAQLDGTIRIGSGPGFRVDIDFRLGG